MDVIRQTLMNEVVDQAFEEMGDDGIFLTAYEVFSSAKSDGGFIDTLLSLHRILTNIPDNHKYKRSVLEHYESVCKEDEFFNSFFAFNKATPPPTIIPSSIAA